MSSGASTPSAPSSPKSDVFSVSHFPIRRDSESTASTAPSSVKSAATEDQGQFPCGETTRPVLHHAKTSSALPTLSSSKLGGHPFSEAAAAASTPATPSAEAHKHDPLSRAFPKPTTTATVEEMLTRNPGKWSLNHWIKHGAEPRARAVNKEAEARRFAETKAALLKSHQNLNGGRSG
ncbi:hypothetical protein V8F06_000798 [Rhypophila decipiens]